MLRLIFALYPRNDTALLLNDIFARVKIRMQRP